MCFEILLLLLSLRAGVPLYTDVRKQYCNQTDTKFHGAKNTADAFNDTKLMIKPVKTKVNNLHMRSILRITEFISVSISGGCPLEITTTLQLSEDNQSQRLKMSYSQQSNSPEKITHNLEEYKR